MYSVTLAASKWTKTPREVGRSRLDQDLKLSIRHQTAATKETDRLMDTEAAGCTHSVPWPELTAWIGMWQELTSWRTAGGTCFYLKSLKTTIRPSPSRAPRGPVALSLMVNFGRSSFKTSFPAEGLPACSLASSVVPHVLLCWVWPGTDPAETLIHRMHPRASSPATSCTHQDLAMLDAGSGGKCSPQSVPLLMEPPRN